MSNVKGPDEAQNPNFEELVAQYQGSVLRMCFLYLCDKTLAEDAVQETFVKVYRGLNSFHGQSSIKTWIWRISLNTCCSIQKRNSRNVPTVPLAIDRDLFSEQDQVGRQVKMLYDRINKLEVFDRAIILLWLESMSYDEIAAIVGITTQAVTSRLFRIKEQLKSMSNN